MTLDHGKPPHGIKTFLSVAEIEQEPGFIPNNPIDKENFWDISGDYAFPEEELRCCYRKENGNLCLEVHRHGYVAILKDQSKTVIGNNCAQEKFGVNSNFHQSRRRYENLKRQTAKLGRLAEFMAQRETIEAPLQGIRSEAIALRDRLQAFNYELGPLNARQLTDMAKVNRSDVNIIAISVRDYVDEQGRPKQERTPISRKLGVLQGIELFRPDAINFILNGIQHVRLAFLRAESLGRSTKKPRATEIDNLVATIANRARFAIAMDDLRRWDANFFANDFELLCYLTDDRVDRQRAAHMALRRRGKDGNKDQIKTFITQLDARYMQQFGAKQLRIGS